MTKTRRNSQYEPEKEEIRKIHTILQKKPQSQSEISSSDVGEEPPTYSNSIEFKSFVKARTINFISNGIEFEKLIKSVCSEPREIQSILRLKTEEAKLMKSSSRFYTVIADATFMAFFHMRFEIYHALREKDEHISGKTVSQEDSERLAYLERTDIREFKFFLAQETRIALGRYKHKATHGLVAELTKYLLNLPAHDADFDPKLIQKRNTRRRHYYDPSFSSFVPELEEGALLKDIKQIFNFSAT